MIYTSSSETLNSILTVKYRGEIAVRILSSARELGLHTITTSTTDDDAHTSYAHESIQLPSVSSYMDVELLVSLCKTHRVDLVHPGYGFLSESAEFCEQLNAAGITFIGPSPDILRRTGDKLTARNLAGECGVPVLPALAIPVETLDDLRNFAQKVGFPIMIKAVDGGGGRGIRLVRDGNALEPGFQRAVNESPSRKVFAEKAAVGGYRHVEVQILGDGQGNIHHFWERECSIQRRFQKVIEIAPSTITSRSLINSVIDAALRMAKAINYSSLGTWEFLVSPERSEFYFMEVNPRLQVEHTITEAICGVDLVHLQLRIALAWTAGTGFAKDILHFDGFPGAINADDPLPSSSALQLRITAEDPKQDFAASIGRIRQVLFPGGNGVRVDSHLRPGTIISTDFDSLLAKVIVVAHDWNSAVDKATRALQDTVIDGVATNISLLQHVLRSQVFRAHSFDTQWLTDNLHGIIRGNIQNPPRHANSISFKTTAEENKITKKGTDLSGDHIIRKGDRFDIQLEGSTIPTNLGGMSMSVTSVLRNDFPHNLAVRLSTSDDASEQKGNQHDYILRISKQSGLQQGHLQLGKRSNQADSSTLVCPISGQLVEILVEDGEYISEGDAVAIIRQMKMELEVRAHRSGTVKSLFGHEEGDTISVGTVICSILPADSREKL